MNIGVECLIKSQRFLLRPLEVTDVTSGYLSWFEDPDVSRFIVAAASSPSREDIEGFIASRRGRVDVLFLGIFDQETGEHIGNIKFEPIDELRCYAILGILIGAPNWRGKGVAKEVIEASSNWLSLRRHVKQIYLGVDRQNHAAIRAYEKIGFLETADGDILSSTADILAMKLLLTSPTKEE